MLDIECCDPMFELNKFIIILTNLVAFYPIIIAGINDEHYAMIVFIFGMLFSIGFHTCEQTEDHVFLNMSYWYWLMLDVFWGFMSVTISVFYMTNINAYKYHDIILLIIIGITLTYCTYCTESHNAHGEYEIIQLTMVGVVILTGVINLIINNRIYHSWWVFTIIICLFLIGGICQLSCIRKLVKPKYRNYLHSIWHVCIWIIPGLIYQFKQ